MFRFHTIKRKWSNISFCLDFPSNLYDFVQRPTKSQSAMENLWQWQYRHSKISLSWHRHDIQTSRDQWKIGYTHGDTTWPVLNLKHLLCFIRFSPNYFHISCFNAFVKPFFVDDVNTIVPNLIIKNLLKYAVDHNYGARWWYKLNVFYYFYFLLILVFYGFVRIISALDVKYQKKK